MCAESYIKKFGASDGAKGSITYYNNGFVKIFWTILPINVIGKRYFFSNEWIEIRVNFIKPPKNLVSLETCIKPQYMQVKGIRQNISQYCVVIKKRYEKGLPEIITPYKRQEDIKVNLCRHPSRNRSKHGAKTEVSKVYKAGAMSSK